LAAEASPNVTIIVAFGEASAANDAGGVLLTDPHEQVIIYASDYRYRNMNLGIFPSLVVVKFFPAQNGGSLLPLRSFRRPWELK